MRTCAAMAKMYRSIPAWSVAAASRTVHMSRMPLVVLAVAMGHLQHLVQHGLMVERLTERTERIVSVAHPLPRLTLIIFPHSRAS